jgi:hypothetical protein
MSWHPAVWRLGTRYQVLGTVLSASDIRNLVVGLPFLLRSPTGESFLRAAQPAGLAKWLVPAVRVPGVPYKIQICAFPRPRSEAQGGGSS